ncbi:pirin [Spirosoma sp.]|uniref:pirin family protein n=1 Tax=Spirosoma sp. TaxID=1899569 RepID=UPI00261858ED|nr:pirin [Spirosoma sp.]MCX6216434.1 pirin [Spirosoma sp.]
MIDTRTQAQLYVADQRGCSQNRFFRSYHTFNFGSYTAEHRTAFGSLRVLNDDTLGPGHRLSITVDDDTAVVLVPLVGGLEFNSPVASGFLEAGQIQTLWLAKGMTYELINPYETELINFVQLWFSTGSETRLSTSRQSAIDLTMTNQLLPAFALSPLRDDAESAGRGFIGRFDGRAEGTYALKNPANGVFVFVLSGAFEVQNRLLHERDGLSLTNMPDAVVEFEALANNAILLLMEVPLHG